MIEIKWLRKSGVVAAALAAMALFETGCGDDNLKVHPEDGKPVNVSKVIVTNVSFYIESFGTIEAQRTVDIVPQVTAVVKSVNFVEGSFLKSGQTMYEMDERDFRENLVKARSAAENNVAALRLAEDRLRRNEQLAEKQMISADTLETLKNGVSSAKQNVASAEAAVRQAELQLEYCVIRAPMDGVVGKSMVDAGNLALQGQSKLTTIRAIDPIRVVFSIAGRDLPRLQRASSKGKIPLQVVASTEGADPVPGEVEFVDNTIDSTTGTIRGFGLVPNPGHTLWPGQFVEVKVKIGEEQNAAVVEQSAVGIGIEGPYVFVVERETTARVRKVELGEISGNWVWVKNGLKENDAVVTEGQVNLVDKIRVNIVNRAAMPNPATKSL
jgi:multidrug efflux system membrane fusion protein